VKEVRNANVSFNPIYSRGRDQEDPSSKPAQGKLISRPYLEKTHHKKKGLMEWFKW
jgi:hypothetical protein